MDRAGTLATEVRICKLSSRRSNPLGNVVTFQSMPVQLQVFDNLRTEQRKDVRCARKFEPRNDFLGHRSSANEVSFLQHANSLPSL